MRPSIKRLIFASIITLFSATALANLAQYHEDVLCKSKKALAFQDGSDSCDILIVEDSKKDMKLRCQGKLSKDINCSVNFKNTGSTSSTHFYCASRKGSKKLIDKKMDVSFAHYNVSAVVTSSNNSKIIINDENSYTYLKSDYFNVFLEESKKDGELRLWASMEIQIEDEILLKDVKCSYF